VNLPNNIQYKALNDLKPYFHQADAHRLYAAQLDQNAQRLLSLRE
jgi:hypothetical protein